MWADSHEYEAKALKLAEMFAENFRKYEAYASDAVKAAGMLNLLLEM